MGQNLDGTNYSPLQILKILEAARLNTTDMTDKAILEGLEYLVKKMSGLQRNDRSEDWQLYKKRQPCSTD